MTHPIVNGRTPITAVLFLVLFTMPAGSSMAQRGLASFQGTVKDDERQPLEGATLYLKDLARGTEIDFKTNKKGSFYRTGLRPSEYELTIEKEGYQPFRDRLRFRANEEKRLDFLLGAATSPAEEAFQRGLSAFNEGDYAKAAAAFEEAARLAPDAAEAHTNLGLTYLQLSRTEEAIGELENAVALAPSSFQIELQLAAAYAQGQKLEEAIAAFEKALERPHDASDPLAVEANLSLGSLYFSTGSAAKAITVYEKALSGRAGAPEALLGLGKCFFQQGDLSKARDYFERVVSVAPDSGQATEAKAFVAEIEKLQAKR